MELMSLLAKLTLDKSQYDKGLEEAEKDAKGLKVPTVSIPKPDNTAFNAGVKEAEDTGNLFKEVMKGVWSGIKDAIVVTGITSAVMGVVGAMRQGITIAAETGDAVAKGAENLQMSNRAYQEFNYTLGKSNIKISDLKTAMTNLDKIRAGKGTKNQVAYLETLQLDAHDASLSIETLMNAIHDYEGNDKGSIIDAFFGTNKKWTGYFSQTTEEIEKLKKKAEKLGMIMSDESIQNAVDYKDATEQLSNTLESLKREFGESILPLLTEAVKSVKQIVDFFSGRDGAIGEAFDNAKTKLGDFIDTMNEAFGASGRAGKVYESYANKMASSFSEITSESGFMSWINELKTGLYDAGVSFDKVQKIVNHFERQGMNADQSGIRSSLLQLAGIGSPYGLDELTEQWATYDAYFEENPVEPPVKPDLDEEQLQAEIQKAQEEASGGITLPVNPSIGMIGDPNWKDHTGAQGNWINVPFHQAKGDWDVPYDNYPSLLHRGEMVLTASQARQYREGGVGDTSAIVNAIQGLRNDMANLKLVVGRKTFGKAVVDYGGSGVNSYIGGSESRLAAGYGT